MIKLIKSSTWLDLAIDVKNSVILAIWRRVVATMIFGLLITIAYHQGYAVNQPILSTLIPGVVLGLLLVFRTNTAYNRFWEGCERISNTPLPRPYSIHLKHLLLLYCFALPFQFVKELDWFTIPVVGIISFALLGIEDIGVEIENPFGYDRNDLPLDQICQKLQA